MIVSDLHCGNTYGLTPPQSLQRFCPSREIPRKDSSPDYLTSYHIGNKAVHIKKLINEIAEWLLVSGYIGKADLPAVLHNLDTILRRVKRG